MATLSIVGDTREGQELVAAADARSVRSLTGNPDDTRVIARFNWSRSLHTWHSTGGAPPALDDVSAWVPISGATRPTYRCTPEDVGCWIRATVVPLLRGAAGPMAPGGAEGSRPFLRALTGPVLEPLPVGSYSQDSEQDWLAAQQFQQQQQLQQQQPHLAPSLPPRQPQPAESVVVVEGQYTAVAEGGNRLMVHLSPRQVLRSSSPAGSPNAAAAAAAQSRAQAHAQAQAAQLGPHLMPPSSPPPAPQAYAGTSTGPTYLTTGYHDTHQHSVPVVPQPSLHSTWSDAGLTASLSAPPPRHLHASQSAQSPHGHARANLDVSLSAAAAAAASAAAVDGAASMGARRLHRSATSPEQPRQPQFQPKAAPAKILEAAALPPASYAYQPQPPLPSQQQYQQQPAMQEPLPAAQQAQAYGRQEPRYLHQSASMPAHPQAPQHTTGPDAGATLTTEAGGSRALHRFATSPDRMRAPESWSQDPGAVLPPQPSAEPAPAPHFATAPQPNVAGAGQDYIVDYARGTALLASASTLPAHLHESVSLPAPQHPSQEPQAQQLQGHESVSFGTAATTRQLHRFNTSPDRIRHGSLANAWMAQEPQPPAAAAVAAQQQQQQQQQSQQALHTQPSLVRQASAAAPGQQPVQSAGSLLQTAAAAAAVYQQEQQEQHQRQQRQQRQEQELQLHAFASIPPDRVAVQPIQPLPPAHILTSASVAPSGVAASSPRRMARSATSPDRGRTPGRWNQIMDPLFQPSSADASGAVVLDAARSPGSFSDFLQSARAAAASRAGAKAPAQAAADASAAGAAAAGAGAATLREGAMGTPVPALAQAAVGLAGSAPAAAVLEGMPSPLPPQRLEEAFGEHGAGARDGGLGGGGDALREALDHVLAQHHEAVQQVVLDHAALQQHALASQLPPPPQAAPATAHLTAAEPGQAQAAALSGSSWRAPRASTASGGSSVSLSLSSAPLPAPSLAQQPHPETQQRQSSAAAPDSMSGTSSGSSSGGGASGEAGRPALAREELQAEHLQQVVQHAQLEEEAQAALREGASGEEVLQALRALRSRGASGKSLGPRSTSQRSMAVAPPPPPPPPPLPSFTQQQQQHEAAALSMPSELLELMAEEAKMHEAMESVAAAAALGAGAGGRRSLSRGQSGLTAAPSATATGNGDGAGTGRGQAVASVPEEALTTMRGMNAALLAQLAESSRLQAQMQRALDAAVGQLQQLQAQQEQQQQQQPQQPALPPLQAQQAGDIPVSPPHRLAQPAASRPQQSGSKQAPAHAAAATAAAASASSPAPRRSVPPSQAAAEQAVLGSAAGELPVIAGLDPAAAAALRAALQQQHQRWKRKKAKLKEQAQAWQYTAWRYATAWKQSREVVQALIAAQQGGEPQRVPDVAADSAPPEPASRPPEDFRPLPPRSAPVRSSTTAAAPAAAVAAPAPPQPQQHAPRGAPPLSPTGLAAGIATLLRSRHQLPVPSSLGPLFPSAGVPASHATAAAPAAAAPQTAAYTARAARRAVATSAVAASGGAMAATVASAARSRSVERARRDKPRAKSPPRQAVVAAEGRTDRFAAVAAPASKQDPPYAGASDAAVAAGSPAFAATAEAAGAVAGADGGGAVPGGSQGAGGAPMPDVGRARDQTSRGRSRSAGRGGREGPGPALEVAAHWPATLRSSGDGSRPRSPSPDGRPPFKPAVVPGSPPRLHHQNHVTFSVYGGRQPVAPSQLGAQAAALPSAPGQQLALSAQQGSGGQQAAPYAHQHQQQPLDPALVDVPRPYRDPQGWWHIPDRWIDIYDPPVHALSIAASGAAQPPRPFIRTQ